MQGHPKQTGHSEEFWQNVVHWRRRWQTAPVSLPPEPHKQYEKRKSDAGIRAPGQKASNMLLGKGRGQLLIAQKEWRGWAVLLWLSAGESKARGYNEQYGIRTWNQGKLDVVKYEMAKSEYRHQWTKMDGNGQI